MNGRRSGHGRRRLRDRQRGNLHKKKYECDGGPEQSGTVVSMQHGWLSVWRGVRVDRLRASSYTTLRLEPSAAKPDLELKYRLSEAREAILAVPQMPEKE